jgi:hypothetical protein
MHLQLNELLALRDGKGTAESVRHVERCDACRAELEELRATATALKNLPSFAPPIEAWAEIRQRVVSRRRRSAGLRFALIAASLLAVAAVPLLTQVGNSRDAVKPAGNRETRVVVEYLSAASRELEQVLRDPSLQSRVLSPQRAAMIVELEDRIALVDMALARQADQEPGERAVALWSDRVELLDALVTARSGEPPEVGVIPVEKKEQGSLL